MDVLSGRHDIDTDTRVDLIHWLGAYREDAGVQRFIVRLIVSDGEEREWRAALRALQRIDSETRELFFASIMRKDGASGGRTRALASSLTSSAETVEDVRRLCAVIGNQQTPREARRAILAGLGDKSNLFLRRSTIGTVLAGELERLKETLDGDHELAAGVTSLLVRVQADAGPIGPAKVKVEDEIRACESSLVAITIQLQNADIRDEERRRLESVASVLSKRLADARRLLDAIAQGNAGKTVSLMEMGARKAVAKEDASRQLRARYSAALKKSLLVASAQTPRKFRMVSTSALVMGPIAAIVLVLPQGMLVRFFLRRGTRVGRAAAVGLVFTLVGTALVIVVLCTALTAAEREAETAMGRDAMRAVASRFAAYADSHCGEFPPADNWADSLVTKGDERPRLYLTWPFGEGKSSEGLQTDVEYVGFPSGRVGDGGGVVAWQRVPNISRGGDRVGRFVMYADFRIEWLDEKAFEERLRTQLPE
jgi:hypothetical protein